MVALECPICNNAYQVSPSRVGIRRTCSKKCFYQYKKSLEVWNKGLTKSDPRVKKYIDAMSKTRKGKKLPHLKEYQFSKGYIPHNAGTAKIKLKKGICCGDKHWNWKGGISKKDKNERTKFLKYVAPKILQRDNYICSICNIRGGILHVDHIKRWSAFPELRFNLNNCRTLCRSCHYKITFGKPMPKESKWGISSIPHTLGV